MSVFSNNTTCTPLCFMPDGRLVCYSHGDFFVLKSDKELIRFKHLTGFKEWVLGRCRVINRLFRMGIRAAEAIDNNNLLISRGSWIYELNVEIGSLSKGYFCGDGIRPLMFTTVRGITGFDDGIYFGGYLSNDEKKSVGIYRRIGVDLWEVVFTFPQGVINHVHTIVCDSFRQCVWIFTGDFGTAAAIWKVTDGFKKVERVVCDDQKYRGCVVFALPEGLLYATDAPFADNFIYLMDPKTYDVKEICPINGSCIYGCLWKSKFVFSSTVEGDGRDMSRMEWLFTRKRGAGIKDDFVHLYCGSLVDAFKEIYNEKKDCLPYYTFQFGVFKFPYGVNHSDSLYFQPVATEKNDLKLMTYKDD